MRFSARTISRAAAVAATAALLALAACSSSNGASSTSAAPSQPATAGASPSASASASQPAVVPSADLSGVSVSDEDTPVITVAAPWGIAATQSKVLREGGAQVLTETSQVTVNYVGVNGTTGQIFDSSFERGTPLPLNLDGGAIAGFSKGLVGQKVGSRVLIGIAPEDGYVQGTPDGAIKPGDSLIFVVDIVSANFEEATGEEVAPAEGLPTVTLSDKGPEIEIPEGMQPPAELVVQPLIKGSGTAITETSNVEVKYRAWNLADGAVVVDGWVKQSGVLSNLIQGWRQGLLGQTAGSRVMLIVPADLAYPDGDAKHGLKPGQNLIYVIDVLNVQAA